MEGWDQDKEGERWQLGNQLSKLEGPPHALCQEWVGSPLPIRCPELTQGIQLFLISPLQGVDAKRGLRMP